ncbi:GAF domain-containing protein [Chloroflexota bacterium]
MAARVKRPATKRLPLDLDLPGVKAILDCVEDELLVIDSDYRLVFANNIARHRLDLEKKTGLSPGKRCYEILQGRDAPCRRPLWQCPLRKVLDNGAGVTVLHQTQDGETTRYINIKAYPLRVGIKDTAAIIEIRRDVTAERELESHILRQRHQLLTLNHISNAVSLSHNLDDILKIALEDILELVGGVVGGILLLDGKTQTLYYRVKHGLSSRYVEDSHISLGSGLAGRAAQNGEPLLIEDINQDARITPEELVNTEGIKSAISIPLKSRDKVVGVLNVFSHMAQRFSAEEVSLLNSIGDYLGTAIEQAELYERLERVGERYKILLQHALAAQEKERKRIARELHDDTAQSLTSLTLNLQAIIGVAELKGYDDPAFLGKLRKTHAYAVQIGNEIVKMMKELRPTLLDELGLPAAIHRYTKDTLQSRGINVSTDFKGTDRRLPPEVEVTLFRITQGVIGNILEHSGAKNASVKLECNDTECQLVIADDGKGFDVSRLTSVERDGRGAGLFIMRERTSQLGGRGYVQSKPGEGTEVIVELPLNRTAADLARELTNEDDTGINS